MKYPSLKTIFSLFFLVLVCSIFSMPPTLKIGNKTLYRPNINLFLLGQNIKPNLDLKLGLDLAGGSRLTYAVDTSKIDPVSLTSALDSLKENIERRVNLFGVSEATVQLVTQGNQYRLVVELPGVSDVSEAIQLIGQTARLEFKGEVDLPPEATASATLEKLFAQDLKLNGSHVKLATPTLNQQNGEPVVSIAFNSEGTDIFAKATKDLLHKRIAIFLDNYLLMAPVVNDIIPNGQAIISGGFTTDSIKTLSAQLNAGALPMPLNLISQTNIGATLGQDTIQKGLTAGLLGLGLVALFMVGNYGIMGVVALLNLFIYTVITITIYKLLPVTLTFPGIVGLLLSIGMAVDSNILTFERVKEERRAGRPWSVALELGFGRAWDAIKGANICTIITSLILYNPLNWSFLNSSGLIRGFAVTLLLGIVISLFTGIVVSRNLLRLIFSRLKS